LRERGRAFRLKKKREHYERKKKIKELRTEQPKRKLNKQQILDMHYGSDER
jgi:hypothetical protein